MLINFGQIIETYNKQGAKNNTGTSTNTFISMSTYHIKIDLKISKLV